MVRLFGTPTNIPNPEEYWIFAEKTFRVFLSLIILTLITKMTSVFFQAAGRPIMAIIASMIRDIVCFVPLIIILPMYFGLDGILYAAPIADFVSAVITAVLIYRFFTELKREALR